MKILVTGGAGFIGGHLVARLVARGHDVRVIDNFSTGDRRNIEAVSSDIHLIEGDIRSYERASTAVLGCEVVFHLAALPSVPRSVQDPLTSHASNVTALLNVMLAARDAGIRRFVYASSSSVYGANAGLPKREDMMLLPLSPYAVTKVAGEGYCRAFREVYGLETVAMRYFNVFGPWQDARSDYAAVVPTFIKSLMRGQAPTIYGDGQQSRDFTYVANVVDANLLALDAGRILCGVYNIACGEQTTVNELFAEICALLGSDIAPVMCPARPGEVRHSLADISAARDELGYRPTVLLREGLARTIAHLREQFYDRSDLRNLALP